MEKLPRKILYICDQKKCKHCSVRDDGGDTDWFCTHTADISHAKNYTTQPPMRVIEKKFKHDIWPMPVPTEVYMEEEK